MKTEQFLEDIFYVKDNSGLLKLNEVKQLSDELSDSIKSKKYDMTERLIETIEYKRLVETIDDFNSMPILVSYTGAVYQLKIKYRSYSLLFGDSGTDKGGIDTINLELNRLVGIDNNKSIRDIIKPPGGESFRNGNLRILLNSWSYHQPIKGMESTENVRGEWTGEGLFKAGRNKNWLQMQDMTLFNGKSVDGILQYGSDYNVIGKRYIASNIRSEYFLLKGNDLGNVWHSSDQLFKRDIGIKVSQTEVDNLTLVRDENGGIFINIIDENEINRMDFYVHTIFNKFKDRDNVNKLIRDWAELKLNESNISRPAQKRGKVRLNKEIITELIDESQENKEFIEDYLKRSLVMIEKKEYGVYYYNSETDKLEGKGSDNRVYKNGINLESLYRQTTFTFNDRNEYIEVTNIVSFHEDYLETGNFSEGVTSYSKSMPMNIVLTYNGNQSRDFFLVSDRKLSNENKRRFGTDSLEIRYIVRGDKIGVYMNPSIGGLRESEEYKHIKLQGSVLPTHKVIMEDVEESGIELGFYSKITQNLSKSINGKDSYKPDKKEQDFLRKTKWEDYDKELNKNENILDGNEVSIPVMPLNQDGILEFSDKIGDSLIYNIYLESDFTENEYIN